MELLTYSQWGTFGLIVVQDEKELEGHADPGCSPIFSEDHKQKRLHSAPTWSHLFGFGPSRFLNFLFSVYQQCRMVLHWVETGDIKSRNVSTDCGVSAPSCLALNIMYTYSVDSKYFYIQEVHILACQYRSVSFLQQTCWLKKGKEEKKKRTLIPALTHSRDLRRLS